MVTADDVRFADPPAMVLTTPDFEGVLDDLRLRCSMRLHSATVPEARALVEPFLRSWEIDFGMQRSRPQFTFRLRDWEVVDRDPPAGTLPSLRLRATATVSDQASAVVTYQEYPLPPTSFRAAPETEILWRRFVRYREGAEPLPPMAYFCITFLEKQYGSGRNLTEQLMVSRNVLDKVRELASTRGDLDIARKGDVSVPLANDERNWLEAALLLLIRRTGTVGSESPSITMAHLPKIG